MFCFSCGVEFVPSTPAVGYPTRLVELSTPRRLPSVQINPAIVYDWAFVVSTPFHRPVNGRNPAAAHLHHLQLQRLKIYLFALYLRSIKMGNAVNAGADNEELTDNLCEADYIRTKKIERIFRAVDRGEYILPEYRANAYRDQAWRSNHLHLSAPCIYSEVMEGLGLGPGMSFLNLGSGTGYLSTLVGLILGCNGINHGVEYYEDVIQYANKKLEDFKRYSGAVDEFDFCEPKFIQGNCLCLTSDRRYDRVYVGAACPSAFDSYLKNLVKVGGILVMPFHDQLLQVRREAENTWSATSLLPVSFATLILPKEDCKDTFDLLDLQPDSLEKLCRTKIRNILRTTIESDHPELCRPTERQAKSPRQRTKVPGRRHMCREMEDIFMRCSALEPQEAPLMPDHSNLIRDIIFNSDSSTTTEEADGENDENDNEADGEGETEEEDRSHLHHNCERASAHAQAQAQVSTNNHNNISAQLTQALSSVPGVSVSPITSPQQSQQQQRMKCRKLDSGIGDEDSNDEEQAGDSGQAQSKRSKLGWFNRFMKRTPESGTGTSTSVDEESLVAVVEEVMEQGEVIVSPLLNLDDDDDSSITIEEDDDSDEYPEEAPVDNEHYHKRRTVESPFTDLMCKKINELPLPPTLKSFLNFYR